MQGGTKREFSVKTKIQGKKKLERLQKVMPQKKSYRNSSESNTFSKEKKSFFY